MGGRKILRVAILAFSGFTVAVQLAYCILDRIFHTTFVVAVLFFLIYFFLYRYWERGYLRDRNLSHTCVGVVLAVIFTACIWSPAAFRSTEMFNGGIGYISVKWFGNDLYCISNGREVSVEAQVSYKNIYITNEKEGVHVMKSHFLQMSEGLTCEEEPEALLFYDDNQKLVVIADRLKKNGYELWVVRPLTDQFKYKNIFGKVPHIRTYRFKNDR